jgi:glutamate racemase
MIGIFDSGLGGLTVLKEIKQKMPGYDYIYLGDTLRVPYGNRSDEAIYDLTKNAVDFLFSKGAKLIIIACNTASAKALRRLQQEYLPERNNEDENILGVIRPLAEYFSANNMEKVGVIGTRGTRAANVYQYEISKINQNIQVVQQATPLLVPLIEENWIDSDITENILQTYLKMLKVYKVQGIILGCTHYPFLKEKIEKIMGSQCHVPHPGNIVALKLKDYLQRHPEINKKLSKNKRRDYYVTDLTENFHDIASRFLEEKIKITKVII